MIRPWQTGPARGTKDTIPFPDHRTLAEAWKGTFEALKRQSDERKKPSRRA